MSAIGNITVTDGTVDHVFTPIQAHPPIYRNQANADTPEIGQEEIQVVVTRAKGNQQNRVRVVSRIPVLETSAGSGPSGYVAAPAVAFTIMAVTDYYIPNRSSAAQRLISRNLHRNLMNDPQVIDAIEKLNQPF